MIDKKIVQQHFSRKAFRYDSNATVQKQMAEVLDTWLASAGAAAKGGILDVGCGTGGMVEHLIRRFPGCRIVAVDLAPGMIAAARRKTIGAPVTFICGDIETLELGQQYDLIVSNAAFQWLNDPGATLEKLYRRLNPGGRIAIATFGPDTFRELHQSFQWAQRRLGIETEILPGQRFISSAHWEILCRESLGSEGEAAFEFTCQEHRVVQYFASVREFLQVVKQTGANNSNRERSIHPALTREQLKIYEERFRVGGRIGATYHCIYVMIRKKGELIGRENTFGAAISRDCPDRRDRQVRVE